MLIFHSHDWVMLLPRIPSSSSEAAVQVNSRDFPET